MKPAERPTPPPDDAVPADSAASPTDEPRQGGTSTPDEPGAATATEAASKDVVPAEAEGAENAASDAVAESAAAEPAEDVAPPPVPPQQWVLIGAGLAHLEAIRLWGRKPIPGVELTLLTAFDRAAYSPLVTGVLAGDLPADAHLIDLTQFTAKRRVRLIVDRAVAIDPLTQTIRCAHQPDIVYDVAGLNIGSVPRGERFCQMHRALISVKPLVTLPERFEKRLHEWRSQQRDAGVDDPLRLAVVGGGLSGIELVLCLAARLRNDAVPCELTLIEAGDEVAPTLPAAARELVKTILHNERITVRLRSQVEDCDDDGWGLTLTCVAGSRLTCDLAVWATTAEPPAVVARWPLTRGESGFLSTRATLQSIDADNLFVTGDAAELANCERSAVEALRQGRHLLRNLRRLRRGQPLKPYVPSGGTGRRWLSMGDRTALVSRLLGKPYHAVWTWHCKRRYEQRKRRRFG